MFEDGVAGGNGSAEPAFAAAWPVTRSIRPIDLDPDAGEVERWRRVLERWALEVADVPADDSGRGEESEDPTGMAARALALIGQLESVRHAAAAAQAALAVRVDRCRRAQESAAGVPAVRRGRGVAAEVALARRVSAHAGSRLLGLGKILTADMPHTFARLATGELSEWRATLLARETACLDIEDRVAVDAELCADPATLAGRGDRAVVATAKRAALRRDAASVVRRAELAASERRVWLRPAPEQMSYLTALVPLTQGVAAYAALRRAADATRATGQHGGRSRGQVMADTLVERATGQAEAAAVPIRVDLLMTEAAVLGADTEPAVVPGQGPVPAAWARQQIGRGGAVAWVRRLYTAPDSADLVAMDARSRRIPTGLAEFIRLRDQDTCRMPWCDAPLRHHDHIAPVADGGPTTASNLHGLCEAHNYAKQAPGWTMTARDGGRLRPTGTARRAAAQRVDIRTPAGQRYRTRPPEPPRSRPRRALGHDATGPAP